MDLQYVISAPFSMYCIILFGIFLNKWDHWKKHKYYKTKILQNTNITKHNIRKKQISQKHRYNKTQLLQKHRNKKNIKKTQIHISRH